MHAGGPQDGKGKAVFVFLGTDSSKDKTMVKNQMKTNWQLSQNPDEDMAIAREAVDYARDTIRELRGKKRGMLTRVGGLLWRACCRSSGCSNPPQQHPNKHACMHACMPACMHRGQLRWGTA